MAAVTNRRGERGVHCGLWTVASFKVDLNKLVYQLYSCNKITVLIITVTQCKIKITATSKVLIILSYYEY